MGFYNNLCPGCMNEVGEAEVCPYCGFDLKTKQTAPYLAYGTVLAGKYVIGDILEQNSEGVTYLGLDTITNTCVRVREFLPGTLCSRASDDTRISIFGDEQEFKGLVNSFLSLWHKLMKIRTMENIITVLDVFEANDTAYAVAEADGSQTLTDYLAENGNVLKWEEVQDKLFPVLDVLQSINEAGVVHGAISPDTLFLCNNGKFKLWGFAIPEARITEGAIPPDIRPGYAALEQYGKSGKLNQATDVYGFAAVLYKCVTGNMPIDAQIRYVDDSLSIPAEYAREMPDYVLAAFVGALQVNAEFRTPNIAAFKNSFSKEAFLQQKMQAAAVAGASLIDPISEMDDDYTEAEDKTVAPVIVSGPAELPVVKTDTTDGGKVSTSSTIVLSVCIVLVMLIFFSCLALTGIISFNFGAGATQKVVEMPNFENYEKSDIVIKEFAESSGLYIKLQPASSDTVPTGIIFEQNVAAGTKIARGSTVILTYSQGFSTVTLPNFIGMPFTETIYYLGKLNLSYNIVEKANPGNQTAGHVASMTPASGSVVYEGTEVTVEIWGDAPANGDIVGPNTGSSVSSSSSVLDSIFGSLSDSVSGLGNTIQNFFG